LIDIVTFYFDFKSQYLDAEDSGAVIMGLCQHGMARPQVADGGTASNIIIIFINCNWVITRWQWLFYMYTNMEKKVTRKFKSVGLHERHVVVTWKLGNHLSIHL
jgi:hypothetical protein